jgi:hypothetical protein
LPLRRAAWGPPDRAGELDDEEGVALRAREQVLDETRGRAADDACDQIGDRRWRQGPETDLRSIAGHAGEALCCARRRARVAVARRRQDEHAHGPRRVGEEGQEVERQQIRGVQVVEHPDDGPRARALREGREDVLPESERVRVTAALDAERAKAFPEGEVGGGLGGLPRAAGDDLGAAPPGLLGDRLDETRLADACLADDEDQAPSAALGAQQRLPQGGQGAGASEQRRLHRRADYSLGAPSHPSTRPRRRPGDRGCTPS